MRMARGARGAHVALSSLLVFVCVTSQFIVACAIRGHGESSQLAFAADASSKKLPGVPLNNDAKGAENAQKTGSPAASQLIADRGFLEPLLLVVVVCCCLSCFFSAQPAVPGKGNGKKGRASSGDSDENAYDVRHRHTDDKTDAESDLSTQDEETALFQELQALAKSLPGQVMKRPSGSWGAMLHGVQKRYMVILPSHKDGPLNDQWRDAHLCWFECKADCLAGKEPNGSIPMLLIDRAFVDSACDASQPGHDCCIIKHSGNQHGQELQLYINRQSAHSFCGTIEEYVAKVSLLK